MVVHRKSRQRKAIRIGLRQPSHFRSVFHFKSRVMQGKEAQRMA